MVALLACLFVVGFIVYYVYFVKLPKDVESRVLVEGYDSLMRVLDVYPGKVISKFGGHYYHLQWTRALMNLFLRRQKRQDDIIVTTTMFDGILVRIYIPKKTRTSNAAVLYFHGGGFSRFSIDNFDNQMLKFTRLSNMLVISVSYRLAPEHPYPFPGIDCLKATLYFLKFGYRNYGVDPSKVFLMGDSAGANLAAVITRKISHRTDVPALKAHILVYPWLQFVDFQTPSYQLQKKHYSSNSGLLSPEHLASMMLFYFGLDVTISRIDAICKNKHLTRAARKHSFLNFVQHEALPAKCRDPSYYSKPLNPEGYEELYALLKPLIFNPDVSPLMAKDTERLPPAMVLTCGYDVLRDDGIWYVQKLHGAGVRVSWKHYEGAVHGSLTMPFGPGTKMMQDIIQYIRDNE